MIQDAAYQSLLNRTRQHHHLRVAKIYEEQVPDVARSEPEVLAHHYREAGRAQEAAKYWHLAGEVAAQRSANAEAVVHLHAGLADLEKLSATAERDCMELAILKTLGPAVIATEGYGSEQVKNTYERAKAVGEKVGEPIDQFLIARGLSELYRLRGEALLAEEATNADVAEADLRLAQEVAQRQAAKSLELRACISLSRLMSQQERNAEALALLAPTYEWFTEGFDTADLQDGRCLVEDLRHAMAS